MDCPICQEYEQLKSEYQATVAEMTNALKYGVMSTTQYTKLARACRKARADFGEAQIRLEAHDRIHAKAS